MLGFWIYLMSDCLIFAICSRPTACSARNYAGGPGAEGSVRPAAGRASTRDAAVLVDHLRLRHAGDAAERACGATLLWLAVTGLFGLAFIGIELYEFAHLIHEGATPQRSAFLSSFFTLVGTHGLHVTFGIVWLVTLMVQVGSAA